MITELAVERVEFTCGHCWRQWTVDYDVQHYSDNDATDWEYFSLDGQPTQSPYTPHGAQPCPQCGRHWVGRLLARRPVSTPPGLADRPREPVTDPVAHRAERRHAPLLGARDHKQPIQPGPPGPGSWTEGNEPEPTTGERR